MLEITRAMLDITPDGYRMLCYPVRLPQATQDRIAKIKDDHIQGMKKTGSVAEYEVREATRAEDNILEGKIGEEIAVEFMRLLGFRASVDWKIYNASEKRHDADLKELGIGVKTCTDVTLSFTDEPSAMYQYGRNPDPIFRITDEDWLANHHDLLVYIPSHASSVGVIVCAASRLKIKQVAAEPIKVSLRGGKRCLYVRDLPYRDGLDAVGPGMTSWSKYLQVLIDSV